jgi:hypothetical protein
MVVKRSDPAATLPPTVRTSRRAAVLKGGAKVVVTASRYAAVLKGSELDGGNAHLDDGGQVPVVRRSELDGGIGEGGGDSMIVKRSESAEMRARFCGWR